MAGEVAHRLVELGLVAAGLADECARVVRHDQLRAAAVEAHPGQTPSVDDYRDSVEQTLIGQAANQQVETWLKEVRRRTRIIYHDEVFQ